MSDKLTYNQAIDRIAELEDERDELQRAVELSQDAYTGTQSELATCREKARGWFNKAERCFESERDLKRDLKLERMAHGEAEDLLHECHKKLVATQARARQLTDDLRAWTKTEVAPVDTGALDTYVAEIVADRDKQINGERAASRKLREKLAAAEEREQEAIEILRELERVHRNHFCGICGAHAEPSLEGWIPPQHKPDCKLMKILNCESDAETLDAALESREHEVLEALCRLFTGKEWSEVAITWDESGPERISINALWGYIHNRHRAMLEQARREGKREGRKLFPSEMRLAERTGREKEREQIEQEKGMVYNEYLDRYFSSKEQSEKTEKWWRGLEENCPLKAAIQAIREADVDNAGDNDAA
jgi:hypothetical protein